MRFVPFLLGCLIAVAAGPAPPAFAAWPYASNVNLPVCTEAGNQSAPVVIGDGSGGTFVVWADHRVSGSRTEIYAQRLDAHGTALWAPGGALVRAGASVFAVPVVAADGAGGVYVAWSTAPAGTYLAFAQHLDATGARQWDTTGVRLSTTAATQANPVVCPDAAGGLFAVWMDYRNGPSPDVYAQRLIANGTPLFGSAGVAVCTAANSQTELALTPDGLGGCLVAWTDYRGADADIYAQRVSSAGATLWSANGATVAIANNDQRVPVVVADGLGGALLVWADERNALNVPDVFGQRLNFYGAQVWTNQGIAISDANGSQSSPVAVSDDAGGMIVAWQTDHNDPYSATDIYAERVDAAGVPRWGSLSFGLVVTSFADEQTAPRIARDGSGGAFIAWRDERSGLADVYARRVTSGGTLMGRLGGNVVCDATGAQTEVAMTVDDRGGAVLAWTDARGGTTDVYAQRVDHSLLLGDPAPVLTAVADVPLDQGGAVRLDWNASDRDGSPSMLLDDYEIWREVPPQSAAFRALVRSRGTTSDPDEAVRTGRLLVGASGETHAAWEYVTSVGDGYGPTYSVVVATAADSCAAGDALTTFLVQLRGGDGSRWPSEPMSGRSIDNLAPPPPQGFVGAYGANSVHLSWLPGTVADFSHFEVYRGESAVFVTGPSNLVVAQADTGYTDVIASPSSWFYKLRAFDVHGNFTVASLVSPPSTDVTPLASAAECRLSAPAPNPAHGRTLVRFTLPVAGLARLALFDVAGREVRVIVDRELPAGEHDVTIAWSGAGEPSLASGVYLLRLEAAGFARTRRLAVIR